MPASLTNPPLPRPVACHGSEGVVLNAVGATDDIHSWCLGSLQLTCLPQMVITAKLPACVRSRKCGNCDPTQETNSANGAFLRNGWMNLPRMEHYGPASARLITPCRAEGSVPAFYSRTAPGSSHSSPAYRRAYPPTRRAKSTACCGHRINQELERLPCSSHLV